MKFATKVVHGGLKPDPLTGAVATPIYQTSTFAQQSPGVHKGFAYARGTNPTRRALESSIASLENGQYGLTYASGIAAADAIIRMFKPGDEVISTSDLYGGSYRLFRQMFEPAGIVFKFIDLNEQTEIEKSITENTKLIWLETPTNPMMNIIDISMVVKVAKKHDILVAVDNTFATPCLQLPLELGADISMHSATKYLGGHSDLIMGAIVVNDESLFQKLKFIQNTCGAIPGPNDCFLVLRGIKTLQLRMERSCANAMEIAKFLNNHTVVEKVNYPGLQGHPGHLLAKKQMSDFGAMISFTLKDDRQEAAGKVLEKLKIFTLAESLGGVESLCGHPATMSHGSMPKDERLTLGIKDSMIRLSIGIEDVEDLIEDLKQALGQRNL
jgi:cystathionine beta-lyase